MAMAIIQNKKKKKKKVTSSVSHSNNPLIQVHNLYMYACMYVIIMLFNAYIFIAEGDKPLSI